MRGRNTVQQDILSIASQLGSEDESIRLAAAEALSRCEEEARVVAVALVRATGDESEAVRELATGVLEELGPPDPAHADQIAALLSDKSPDVGYWAATLLGRLEQQAAGCVQALTSALSDTSSVRVRQRAAWALGKIGPGGAAAAEALRTAAASDDPRLARLAAQALEKTGAS